MSVDRTTRDVATTVAEPWTSRVRVDFVSGEEYAVRLREHALTTDQPADNGGSDHGPSPVEMFVASMAACSAYYAGRYLDRHGLARDGLRVFAEHRMATDRPARVEWVRLEVRVPGGTPEKLLTGLRAVVSHCTVHNTLRQPPEIDIEVV